MIPLDAARAATALALQGLYDEHDWETGRQLLSPQWVRVTEYDLKPAREVTPEMRCLTDRLQPLQFAESDGIR